VKLDVLGALVLELFMVELIDLQSVRLERVMSKNGFIQAQQP
jgi:hypothetical protein